MLENNWSSVQVSRFVCQYSHGTQNWLHASTESPVSKAQATLRPCPDFKLSAQMFHTPHTRETPRLHVTLITRTFGEQHHHLAHPVAHLRTPCQKSTSKLEVTQYPGVGNESLSQNGPTFPDLSPITPRTRKYENGAQMGPETYDLDKEQAKIVVWT